MSPITHLHRVWQLGLSIGVCLVLATTGCTSNQVGETVTSPSLPDPALEATETPAQLTPAASTPAAGLNAPLSPAVGTSAWTAILPGDAVDRLQFTTEGALVYQGTPLLAEIPVTYDSDGNRMLAKRLVVSPPSVSGRFSVVKGCEETTADAGLCWAVFLVDRTTPSATRINVGKYGGLDWVQWSADERYAVFVEQLEGAIWFVVVDTQTGEAKLFAQQPAPANLEGFTWISDRVFEVPLQSCEGETCSDQPAPFQGDIATLFAE